MEKEGDLKKKKEREVQMIFIDDYRYYR